MFVLRKVAEQPVGLMLGFIVASLLFLVTFGLALKTGRVLATHDGNVHACVNLYNGETKVKPPGQPPNCGPYEILVEWPGSALIGDLDDRLQALEEQVPDCLSDDAGTARFSGCNVQIVNGMNNTETVNGLGNLIVGYNENPADEARSGSHNLVVGQEHSYTNYGGLVVGIGNTINGAFSSVSGGIENEASGNFSSVSGGSNNVASGNRSSISGGDTSSASGTGSSVSGGFNNMASGNFSSISAGSINSTDGSFSSVSGGIGNSASGIASSVSGGLDNEASGNTSNVSGGQDNTASGVASSVSGGLSQTTNSADPDHDWRGGGLIQDN